MWISVFELYYGYPHLQYNFPALFFNFLKLNHIHIIEDKFTKYYINIYICYRMFTTWNESRIKEKKIIYQNF